MSKGILVVFAEAVESHWLSVAQQLGPILLAVMAVWIGIWYPSQQVAFGQLDERDGGLWLFLLSQWTPWLFFGVVVFSVLGGILAATESRKKDRRIVELEGELKDFLPLRDQLEEAQQTIGYLQGQQSEFVFKAISDFLAHLSNDHLEFNDTERASLYVHNGERFVLAGRYSKNPDLSSVNRKAFPDGEGCIGQTWKNGGKYFKELPLDEGEYYEYLKSNLSIDKKTAKSLRMRSHAYCSFAIEENHRRVGVLLFESINHGVLDLNGLESITREHEAYLRGMLRQSRESDTLVAYQGEGG